MSDEEKARANDIMIGEFIAQWDDAADGVMMDADTAQELAREFKRMRELIYVPGVYRCAKCSFTLIQSTIRAADGAIGSRDEPGEKCPNDGAPLWRTTYRDQLEDAHARWEEQVNRAVAAERKLAALRGASSGEATVAESVIVAPAAATGGDVKREWLKVKHAHAVGDPHGYAHHAKLLDAAIATLSPCDRDMRDELRAVEPLLAQLAMPSKVDPAWTEAVWRIGNAMGFGALMHTASAQWRELLEENGGAGGEFVVGPCATTARKAWESVSEVLSQTGKREG